MGRGTAPMMFTTLLIAVAPTLGALPQEAAAAAPAASVQEPTRAEIAWKGLQAEYKASELGYREKAAAFQPKFQAIADDYRGTEVGFDAEMQLLGDTWWLDPAERHAAAMARLDGILEFYADSKRLWQVMEKRYNFDRAEQPAIFERIAQLSPHDEVDAAMLFGQAIAERGDDKRRTELFRRLEKEYGELKWRGMTSYTTYVDAYLNPHAKASLAVGQPAPEIEGMGLDGKPMKLSDYRGKVVVLDFWGDW